MAELRRYGFEINIEFVDDFVHHGARSGELMSPETKDRMMGIFFACYVAWRLKWMDRHGV